MPTKAKSVVSDVDLLEEAIEERPKANPFARLKSPWTGVYILLVLTWIKVGGIQDRVFKATDAYSNGPVLVQVGVDAKPILAQQALEGSLNPENVQAFIAEIVPVLNRFDATLPAESGGGIDKGVKQANTKLAIPTPIYLALQAVDQTTAPDWISAHMKNAPLDLYQGAKSTLKNLTISTPTGTGNTRTVTASAIQVTDNPDGSPRSAMLWARKIKVRAIQKPRFILTPNLIERKYNAVLARGLQIQLPITDATEVLP